jgi:uncharacterized protein (DUF1778 family)
MTNTHGGAREGAGRPKSPDKRTNLTFRANSEEREIIQYHADRAGLTVSEYLRLVALKGE